MCFLFDDSVRYKPKNTFLFGDEDETSKNRKAALDATLTFEQDVSFRGFGKGEDVGELEVLSLLGRVTKTRGLVGYEVP